MFEHRVGAVAVHEATSGTVRLILRRAPLIAPILPNPCRNGGRDAQQTPPRAAPADGAAHGGVCAIFERCSLGK
jgi:hypothetical protein